MGASKPYIENNLLFLPFFLLFGFLLASRYSTEKERLRPKLDIFLCLRLFWREDQEDRDRNKPSITPLKNSIKKGLCKDLDMISSCSSLHGL